MQHVYEFAGRDPGTNQGPLSQSIVPRPTAKVVCAVIDDSVSESADSVR